MSFCPDPTRVVCGVVIALVLFGLPAVTLYCFLTGK